jgi:hypothetical protein
MITNSISNRWLNENFRYRFKVFLRVLAGFIGGYILTAYITAITTKLLPMNRADAVVLTSMLSFLWFAGIIIWAFAVKSLLRLYLILTGLIGTIAVLYLVLQSVMAV